MFAIHKRKILLPLWIWLECSTLLTSLKRGSKMITRTATRCALSRCLSLSIRRRLCFSL
uniref:Uncharacterized protein n=1 Tax=Brassica oleracea var. oleracea TaxID=109376 RepID=A0A0D2ZRG8_BRAOL